MSTEKVTRDGIEIHDQPMVWKATPSDADALVRLITKYAEPAQAWRKGQVTVTAQAVRLMISGGNIQFLLVGISNTAIGFATLVRQMDIFSGKEELIWSELFICKEKLSGDSRRFFKALSRSVAKTALDSGFTKVKFDVVKSLDMVVRMHIRHGAVVTNEWTSMEYDEDALESIAGY
jgi:hypothetical protein